MKSIFFNIEDIHSILEGKKTVTRQVVKPVGMQTHFWQPLHDRFIIEEVAPKEWQIWLDKRGNPYTCAIPPYKPNDILYVKEGWEYGRGKSETKYYYRADYTGKFPVTWRSALTMPMGAARIFLRVKDIRVERLQDITEQEAVKEGIRIGLGSKPYFSCKDTFAAVWGHNWEVNPWVWVIDFERISKEEAKQCDQQI